MRGMGKGTDHKTMFQLHYEFSHVSFFIFRLFNWLICGFITLKQAAPQLPACAEIGFGQVKHISMSNILTLTD